MGEGLCVPPKVKKIVGLLRYETQHRLSFDGKIGLIVDISTIYWFEGDISTKLSVYLGRAPKFQI